MKKHRIHLELEINCPTHLHSGSGGSSFTTDRLICRDNANRPYIPASTLKGIIRESCEKLSRTLKFKEPSNPHDKNLTNSQSFVPFDQMQSPVDRLFGTKYEPGGLFFRDAILKKNDEYVQSTIRHRVAIQRELHTAKDKALFSTEYMFPATFTTCIDGWHDEIPMLEGYPPYAYALLIFSIYAVHHIGGDKSTGAGWLDNKICITNALYNGIKLKIKDDIFNKELFDLLDPEWYTESREEL